MENFEKFNAWQSAKTLCLFCYQITKKLPPKENFSLTNQIRRAAISIPSNIAEGYSRKSSKELERFLDIAIGSTFEVMTQIDIALDLKYISRQRERQDL